MPLKDTHYKYNGDIILDCGTLGRAWDARGGPNRLARSGSPLQVARRGEQAL
jgi:hypothetical protein